MVNAVWELNKMEGKNPIHTGGFLTGYDQREFSPEEVAARESGQNAMDAGREVPGITELEFRLVSIEGDAKTAFIKRFGFDELFSERIPAIAEKEKNRSFCHRLEEFLGAEKLTALVIRDFKTCGLGGSWGDYDKGDHFARLVCALNLDDKADGDDASGGSFGLGKTAYAKSSLINTVIYHSVFAPTSRSKGVARRLMAAGVYPSHSYKGHKFGGFAYYGVPIDKTDVAKPFEDEDAESMWSFIEDCCGIKMPRTKDQSGTDIFILMPNLKLPALKAAVEDYYFPAIIEGLLSIRFVDEQGSLSYPQPYSRADLKQYISLYQDLKKETDVKEDGHLVGSLNRHLDCKLGRFAFRAASEESSSPRRSNCVALTRGTGMIINYVRLGSDQYEPAVGLFSADKEVHRYLILSENSAHSEWSEHNAKLEVRFPDSGKNIVKRLNGALRTKFSAFQKDLQPDVVNSKTDSGLLSRLLSDALAGTKGDRPPQKDFLNPVSLHLTRKEREGGFSRWRLQVQENEYTPKDPFEVVLMPSISLAGDSKMVAIKHMEFSIKDQKGKLIEKGTKPRITQEFKRGLSLEYVVEFSNPGAHNYVVFCKCISEPGIRYD